MLVKNYNGEEVEIPEQPLTVNDVGGCKCIWDIEDNVSHWTRNPDCAYHNAAERQPWNHHIPWNCSTYYDGCNCKDGPYFYKP